MLDESVIKRLKQSNISVDAEKTKLRMHEIWDKSSKDSKAAAEALADSKRATTQRIYKTGVISAKLAVALAQVFNVDPSYLTGETDEKGENTDEAVVKFLTVHGYDSLIGKPKRKYTKKQLSETEPVAAEEPVAELAAEFDVYIKVSLSEQEQCLLLQALHLKANLGSKEAADKLAMINELLIK